MEPQAAEPGNVRTPKNPTYYRLVAIYMAILLGPVALLLLPMVGWTVIPCTVYSEEFDEATFQTIDVGEPVSDVIARLGLPYRVVPVYVECWEYDGWSVYFNDDGVVEVERLYQWDREELEHQMGTLPAGVSVASLAGKNRDEMRAAYGSAKVDDGGSADEQFFFYSHPSEGGMWADRTWKKRLFIVDKASRRVKAKHSYWVIAGDPVA